jgi:hypothetical protein
LIQVTALDSQKVQIPFLLTAQGKLAAVKYTKQRAWGKNLIRPWVLQAQLAALTGTSCE